MMRNAWAITIDITNPRSKQSSANVCQIVCGPIAGSTSQSSEPRIPQK